MKKLIKLSLAFVALTLMSFAYFTPPQEEDRITLTDDSDVKFRIEICSYLNHIPHDKVENMRKVGKVHVVKTEGVSHYYSQPYPTEAEATTHLQYFVQSGFPDAKEVVEVENTFISIADYHTLVEIKKAKDIKDADDKKGSKKDNKVH